MGWLDKKRNNFGAVGVRHDGYYFDSKFEGERYIHLRLMEKAGIIAKLDIHVKFDIMVAKIKVCTYAVDFTYIELPSTLVAEEVKGHMTSIASLKIKLFKALYPAYDFRIIKKARR